MTSRKSRMRCGRGSVPPAAAFVVSLGVLALAGAGPGMAADDPKTRPDVGQAEKSTGPVHSDKRARDEAECRAEAYARFEDIPAIHSGRTSYLSGDEVPFFFRECMKARGY